MPTRVVPIADVDGPFIDSWRKLSNRPGIIPNPFADADFLRPAAACLPEAEGLRLLVGEDHGELLWLMPLAPSSQLGKLPMVPGLRNCLPRVFFGQPLIVPGQESVAARSLLTYLSESRRIFWLRLQMLEADDRFAQSLVAGAGRASVHVETFTRGLAVRRPEPTYLSGHSNLKRVGRQRRSFERSSALPLEVIDCSADPRAVDEFLVMESAGWKGRERGAFAAQPGYAEFLRQTCASFRESGRLQLWSLRSGGQTLAMKLNIAAGDTLFCYVIAFAEGYAALSPGLQLEVENFTLFHAEPRFRLMDSCAAPDNAFVNRLYPDRRSLINLTIGSGPVGRVVTSLAPAARRAMERRKVAAAAADVAGSR